MAGLLMLILIFGIANALPYPTSKLDYNGLHQNQSASRMPRYNPDFDNSYHLFTRFNPDISQPLVPGDGNMLLASFFSHLRRTVVLIHGWTDSPVGPFSSVVTRAFLESDDVNVITVDWSIGAHSDEDFMPHAMRASAGAVAWFISWLKDVTGTPAENLHLVGFDLGAHHVGLTSRHVAGGVAYVTGLDPCSGGFFPQDTFHFDDGFYTEAIFTNSGFYGHRVNVADVNFYPNGGIRMPGCGIDDLCSHGRAFDYFAEAIVHGGFTGRQCRTQTHAMTRDCTLPGTLPMGSRFPSPGIRGIYYLETNDLPPYARG